MTRPEALRQLAETARRERIAGVEKIEPAEFERRCAEVRATWTARMERQRRVVKDGEVETVEVKVKDFGEVE